MAQKIPQVDMVINLSHANVEKDLGSNSLKSPVVVEFQRENSEGELEICLVRLRLYENYGSPKVEMVVEGSRETRVERSLSFWTPRRKHTSPRGGSKVSVFRSK